MNTTYLLFAVYLTVHSSTWGKGIWKMPSVLWKYEDLFRGWNVNRESGKMFKNNDVLPQSLKNDQVI